MNFTPAEIEKKSTEYARTLLEYARANEPQITADLQKIAEEISAEMIGLEHRFKAEESLTRKLVYQGVRMFEYELELDFSEERAIRETFSELVERQNDVLRYTFVLPFEKYVFGFRNSLEKLKRQNYEIPEDKIWNAWKNIGASFDKGYRIFQQMRNNLHLKRDFKFAQKIFLKRICKDIH